MALLVLTENSQTKIPLDNILNKFSQQIDAISKLDRSLSNAIIYGTLRWQAYLDWIIQPFSERKLETLKTEVIYILRIAMFQIIFMDRIPVAAAVNTAVELAKKVSHQGTAGFVNAVLRKASTCFKDISFPEAKLEPELYISVAKSMPLWLVRKWISQYGFDATSDLCDTINTIPPITIRANILKIDRDSLINICASDVEQILPTNYSPDGILLKRLSVPIHETKAFINGYFQVQDEAAQLVSIMLSPLLGERILDACAGLGGKTGHIAQLMNNIGTVIACDTDPEKLLCLEKEMSRLGIDIVKTVCKDILKANSCDFVDIGDEQGNSIEVKDRATFGYESSNSSDNNTSCFDRVLVDAPCSGMGVLRRNPDAKWKRTKKDIARLAIRQEKMLLNAANFVKSGGTLLYSVCSCETRENEDVVENFLNQRPDFKIEKNGGGIEAISFLMNINKSQQKIITDKGYFKTYPHNMEMDGFFAALMVRI